MSANSDNMPHHPYIYEMEMRSKEDARRLTVDVISGALNSKIAINNNYYRIIKQ